MNPARLKGPGQKMIMDECRGKVGIGDPDTRHGRLFRIGWNNAGRGTTAGKPVKHPAAGDKGYLPGSSLIKAIQTGYPEFPVADDLPSDQGGQFFQSI